MKKILFTAGTVAVLALASCSNDETSQEALVNPNEIRYEVVTNNSTRANTLWTAASGLKQSFKVYAQDATNAAAAPYINGESVTYSNGAWTPLSTHYWPTFNLDFYAASGTNGAGCEIGWDATNKVSVTNVAIPASSDEQNDMVYAITPNQAKTTNSGKVVFNFRHALAQLVFKAKNVSKGLYVRVAGIKLVNIQNSGSVVYKAAETGTQFIDKDLTGEAQDGQSNDYQGNNTAITWTANTTLGSEYIGADGTFATELSLVAVADDAEATDIVSATDGKDGSMFVIPQAIDPLALTAKTKVENITSGMYFLVRCAICNIASGEGGTPATTDQWVYGDAATTDVDGVSTTTYTYKDILIPVKKFSKSKNADIASWEAGKKYIYTFIFGKDADGNPGNGGLDPEEPDPENPVLKNIEIDTNATTMDDYFIEGTVNQHMTYPDNEAAKTEEGGEQGGGDQGGDQGN